MLLNTDDLLFKKGFAPLQLYSLQLKRAEYVTLSNVKKNIWENTEMLYGNVKTNSPIS